MGVINALIAKSDIFHHLAHHNLTTYVNLMAEAQNFIRAKEIFKAWEASHTVQVGRSERRGKKQVQMPQGDARERSVSPRMERQAPPPMLALLPMPVQLPKNETLISTSFWSYPFFCCSSNRSG